MQFRPGVACARLHQAQERPAHDRSHAVAAAPNPLAFEPDFDDVPVPAARVKCLAQHRIGSVDPV